jgi:hypothetical protein
MSHRRLGGNLAAGCGEAVPIDVVKEWIGRLPFAGGEYKVVFAKTIFTAVASRRAHASSEKWGNGIMLIFVVASVILVVACLLAFLVRIILSEVGKRPQI